MTNFILLQVNFPFIKIQNSFFVVLGLNSFNDGMRKNWGKKLKTRSKGQPNFPQKSDLFFAKLTIDEYLLFCQNENNYCKIIKQLNSFKKGLICNKWCVFLINFVF